MDKCISVSDDLFGMLPGKLSEEKAEVIKLDAGFLEEMSASANNSSHSYRLVKSPLKTAPVPKVAPCPLNYAFRPFAYREFLMAVATHKADSDILPLLTAPPAGSRYSIMSNSIQPLPNYDTYNLQIYYIGDPRLKYILPECQPGQAGVLAVASNLAKSLASNINALFIISHVTGIPIYGPAICIGMGSVQFYVPNEEARLALIAAWNGYFAVRYGHIFVVRTAADHVILRNMLVIPTNTRAFDHPVNFGLPLSEKAPAKSQNIIS